MLFQSSVCLCVGSEGEQVKKKSRSQLLGGAYTQDTLENG